MLCSKIENLAEHPLLEASICCECHERVFAGIAQNNELLQNCNICGRKGTTICTNMNCQLNSIICNKCIEKYYKEKLLPWECFICSTHEILLKRSDWEKKMFNSKINTVQSTFVEKKHTPMRVVSLFDGIGSGYFSLKKLKIQIKEYFASEIDQSAVNISGIKSMGNIIHIGDVRNLCTSKINIGQIDLLIGGSPCTELSLVNPARRGLYDLAGTGILFFEFVRIFYELKSRNPDLLFMFENTAAMERHTKLTISRFLKCEPVLLDSKIFSPMRRARYFWTNIPLSDIPWNERTTNLRDYLAMNSGRTPIVPFIRTITTNRNSLAQGLYRQLPVLMNGKEDALWITELERLFGFDEHYTDVGNISIGKRLSLLGSSWSVPVICFILKKLTEKFPSGIDFSQESVKSPKLISYNFDM